MKWSPNCGVSFMMLSAPESATVFGTITRLPGGVGCGTWNSDCVDTGGLSRLSSQAERMVYALFFPLLAPCPPGDVALDFVRGYGVLQGGHGLAFRKISESDCVETVFQSGCYHFERGEMVTCCVRSPLHARSLFTIPPLRKRTLCHCFPRLGTLNGNSLFLRTPFWGCDPVVGAGTAIVTALWALDVEIPPLVTLPWRGLLFCCLLCLPSSGGFLLGPCGRVCVGVCGCARGCAGCGCLLGCVVGWNLDSFMSPCLL